VPGLDPFGSFPFINGGPDSPSDTIEETGIVGLTQDSLYAGGPSGVFRKAGVPGGWFDLTPAPRFGLQLTSDSRTFAVLWLSEETAPPQRRIIERLDPGDRWVRLDANTATKAIAAGGGKVFQIHDSGLIWEFNPGDPAHWTQLDDNPLSTAIAADKLTGVLFQIHSTGHIWFYNGVQPCGVAASPERRCAGWVLIDNNPESVAITAGGGRLYQLHADGSTWLYNSIACTASTCPGWVKIGSHLQPAAKLFALSARSLPFVPMVPLSPISHGVLGLLSTCLLGISGVLLKRRGLARRDGSLPPVEKTLENKPASQTGKSRGAA
jgi:hypothetical protein